MATNTTLHRAPGTLAHPAIGHPSLISLLLTGMMFIIIVALVASLLNAAAVTPRAGDRLMGPVAPEVPSNNMRIKDGNAEVLDSIAGVPVGTGSTKNGAVKSGRTAPIVDNN